MKSKSILSIISKVAFTFAVVAFACFFICLVLSAAMPGINTTLLMVAVYGICFSFIFFAAGMITLPSEF